MQYSNDKHGSKFLFLIILILFAYLAAFNFDIEAAYLFTAQNMFAFFR
ncbi:MAG TPA: hypothetical protein VI483_02390 [Candidatus Paceibacterota bacterium]